MRMLKSIFNFYLNASIHVALAVCSLVLLTAYKFEIQLPDPLLFFVFFATIGGYNFVKYFGLAKFHHRSLAKWLKQIQIFSLLCFIPMVYLGVKLHEKAIYLLIVLGAITFFYAIPFIPRNLIIDPSRNLRAISGLKIYVIALVWAAVTVLLPFYQLDLSPNFDVWIEFIQRFLYVIIATLPFEIRDLQYDSLKLATIPQQIGIRSTKLLGSCLILLLILLNIFKDELELAHLIIDGIIGMILILTLWISKTTQSTYFTSFWVEAIPIFWFLLILGTSAY